MPALHLPAEYGSRNGNEANRRPFRPVGNGGFFCIKETARQKYRFNKAVL
ncbi:TPA: hypothetical protein ACQUH4_000953 [Neisseria cinerea]